MIKDKTLTFLLCVMLQSSPNWQKKFGTLNNMLFMLLIKSLPSSNLYRDDVLKFMSKYHCARSMAWLKQKSYIYQEGNIIKLTDTGRRAIQRAVFEIKENHEELRTDIEVLGN